MPMTKPVPMRSAARRVLFEERDPRVHHPAGGFREAGDRGGGRAAIKDDDEEGVDTLIPAALARVDTPIIRAQLVRELLALMETGQVHRCAAVTAVFDLSRRESPFLESALLEALAVSAGATTTPSGLLVATS
jgi:hypothetical protein